MPVPVPRTRHAACGESEGSIARVSVQMGNVASLRRKRPTARGKAPPAYAPAACNCCARAISQPYCRRSGYGAAGHRRKKGDGAGVPSAEEMSGGRLTRRAKRLW